jgi:hypothetical protein
VESTDGTTSVQRPADAELHRRLVCGDGDESAPDEAYRAYGGLTLDAGDFRLLVGGRYAPDTVPRKRRATRPPYGTYWSGPRRCRGCESDPRGHRGVT